MGRHMHTILDDDGELGRPGMEHASDLRVLRHVGASLVAREGRRRSAGWLGLDREGSPGGEKSEGCDELF
jgi:hypothetical protein